MNAILTELATKAKVEHCISHVRLQAFAELIIKECITALDHADGSWYHGDILKEYFGVEE